MLISLSWFAAKFAIFATAVAADNTLASIPHSATNADSEPDLPDLGGAFDVEFKVRFDSVDSQFQNLFEYNTLLEDSNRIVLLQSNDVALFRISRDGLTYSCRTQAITSLNVVYHYQFGVTLAHQAYIHRDGVEILACGPMPFPINVQRTKYLGNGPSSSSTSSAYVPVCGAILGVQVTHHGVPNPGLARYEFLNLPGQSFHHPFEVNFFARFDILSDRYWQRVFEFGNAGGADMIWCGQVANTSSMSCGMIENGRLYQVTAANAIDLGTFAFWKFNVDRNGMFRISKNGQQLAAAQTTIIRKKVSRRQHLFGTSTFTGTDDLYGSILGFRLQPF